MKRELAFVLEVQSQLCGSLGRTRSSKPPDVGFNSVPEKFQRKRLKRYDVGMSEVKSSTQHSSSEELLVVESNGFPETAVKDVLNVLPLKIEQSDTAANGSINGECAPGDEPSCDLDKTMCIEERKRELQKTPVDESDAPLEVPESALENSMPVKDSANGLKDSAVQGECAPKDEPICDENTTVSEFRQKLIEEGVPVIASGNEGQNELKGENRRFTRSALNPKASKQVETLAARNGDLEDPDSEKAILNVEKDNVTEMEASRTPKKNLEMKMSKKISINKIPSTTKELLETGLLEGLPVTYNMTGKKESRLRGVIKGNGILCSCNKCKGSWVVTPSRFEIHACRVYRHASQYICLENGKSLQQVLKGCQGTSLDTLDATICNAVGTLHVNEPKTCQNCKGSLPASSTSEESLLCNICLRAETPKTEFESTPSRGRRASLPDQKLLLKSTAASASISSKSKSRLNITKTSPKPNLTLKPSPTSEPISSKSKSKWKITKKHQGLHKLVFEEVGLPDGTELAYYARGQKLLEGYKRGSGIFCFCCQSEVSASLFEVHAGLASRKKPYHNIYTSNGVSLHELSLSLTKGRKCSAKDNDDLCIICADGGNLLLCDGCPRAFHKECASLSSIPRGNWYCKYCQNMFQKENFVAHNLNAVAAGRVSGVDPIEQITKRCIRIIKNPEAGGNGCALCSGRDFHKSGFGPRTVILCDQCEKGYHVGCLKDHQMADLKKLPKGNWFCCSDCTRINSTLQKLLDRGSENLPSSLLNVIRKKHGDKALETSNLDVRWRILSGKMASSETRLLLSKAVSIFHDCFDPIIDSTTGRDFIPSMVYGRNIRGQELGGMYCAVLTVNSTVVSTGIFRIFGQEVAELPLVATCNDFHGKGYFQTLFSCMERLMAFLKIKNWVLPSAEGAESIWTEKFGFERIPPDQLSNYGKNYSQMMVFQGTSMLQKAVPQCRIVQSGAD